MSARVVTRGTPGHRIYQVVGYGLLAVLAVYIVYNLADFRIQKFSLAVCFALAILGLNLVTGFTGQVSLGHSAFFGTGAYTTAILMTEYEWSFFATLPVAAALGFAIGYGIGVPALRLQGLYLALVTLAIGVVFPTFIKWLDDPSHLWGWIKTGGSNGLTVPAIDGWQAPSWLPGDVTQDGWIFIVVSVISALLFWAASNMVRSRVGRGMLAVRDNITGAAVSGVYPARFKTLAFAISSMYASIAGSLYVLTVNTVSPDQFGLFLSIQFIAGLVVGGIATLTGALLGGMLIEFLPYYTSEWLEGARANILFGFILVVMVFIAPGGIMWFVRAMRAKFVVFVPRLPKVSPRGVEAQSGPSVSTTAAVASEAPVHTQGGEA